MDHSYSLLHIALHITNPNCCNHMTQHALGDCVIKFECKSFSFQLSAARINKSEKVLAQSAVEVKKAKATDSGKILCTGKSVALLCICK